MVAVEDGVDALRYVEGHTPSLVVLDLGLPRLGGEDVRRELASRPGIRDIPIVVVTGSDTQRLRKTARRDACFASRTISIRSPITSIG